MERQIPIKRISNKGSIFSRKMNGSIEYESTLERDFIFLSEFDLSVESIKSQPVKIPYKSKSGRNKYYIPDFLLKYKKLNRFVKQEKPLLCEIKYEKHLMNPDSSFELKNEAAKIYAIRKNWNFEILTEKYIRGVYLENVKFLLRFRKIDYNVEHTKVILDTLNELRVTTPEELLMAIYWEKWSRAVIMPMLWHLLSIGEIGCDITMPLTMTSNIWAVHIWKAED